MKVAIAVGIAIAIAISIAVVVRHEQARAAYSREADRFGTRGYSAARSDARYAEVRARQLEAERASFGVAGIAIAIALMTVSRAPSSSSSGKSGSGVRGWIAVAIDAIAIAVTAGAAFVVRDLMGADHAAVFAIAAGLVVGAAIGIPWAMLARGATPAMRLLRVCVDEPPGIVRAGLALAIALLLAPIAPIAAIVRAVRRSDAAPAHLRWLGLALHEHPRPRSGRPG